MEFIGTTLDLDLAFDDQSGWFPLFPYRNFVSYFLGAHFTADAELQDNSLFASSNNSYVSSPLAIGI